MVQQANAQLRSSAPESGLELSYQDYQRGLFSKPSAAGGEADRRSG
ncbi:GTP-binding protein YdgA [Klebsiella pneumoniae]|uniref:GTP-binding protein YdgA n=1 Tax=Klebsiella pneumoniae TaxID=573 RepID=A0A378F5I9_KLEPN|nr:GTP-binding protein YdgA [Klebsiella pneumoniae]